MKAGTWWWVIVALALSGPAWAQTAPQFPECRRPARISERAWQTAFDEEQRFMMCDGETPEQGFARRRAKWEAERRAKQVAKEVAQGWREANPTLKFVGWSMVAVGAAAMIPAGRNVKVFDDTYCVSDYEISAGGCSTPRLQMIVLGGVIGTGFVLAKIGGRHIAVTPTVTKTTKAATATVSWGSK